MLTFREVKKNEAIRTYIQRADESLTALGYTEHSFAHVTQVAEHAGYILETLGYEERTVELAKIAGYLHDIGNVVNLFDSHGDLTMKNVHVDKVNTVFKSNGELQITVDGYDCFCALKTAQMDGGTLTIAGEVVENG